MPEPLRVFAPVAHGERGIGLAGSLRLIGGTMIVNDPAATLGPTTDARFTPERARARFGENVEVYAGEDILARPPDVMIVGRVVEERPAVELWRRLSAIRPVVLCAYSGVFQSPFNLPLYGGVIAEDPATRVIARHHGIPALKFFPHFPFEENPFVPERPKDRVILRSYTSQYATRFPMSHAFHQDCRAALLAEFGDRVVVENVEGVSRQRVRQLIVDSTATLHVKENEGFGWSVVESLAAGRPVISQAGFVRNMTYREWLADGARDALAFDTPADLVALVGRLLADPPWRAALQAEAADTIRRRYSNEANAAALGTFLGALVTVERHRWRPWGGAPSRIPVARFSPTLDRNALQDFERVILGGRPASDFPDV